MTQAAEFFASPSGQIGIVVAVFALTIVAFIADKVRSDIVALSSMALLLVTNVLTPSEALAGFSNSAVVMMIGLFIVGGAVFQTGLAKIISGRLLKLAGTSEVKLFFLVMIVTSVVAAFVSNTGTSRSGSTIIGGLLCGCSRVAASEFSFFMAIPVMFGWSVLKIAKLVLGGVVLTTTELAVGAVGLVVAFVTSVLSIKFLMGYIQKHDFGVFGWYRIALAIVVLVAVFGFGLDPAAA